MSSVKLVLSNKSNKQALEDWEELLASVRNSTPVDLNETPDAKKRRMKELEADPEKWFAYYFPKYAFAKPAPFQIKSTKRVVNSNRIYQRRAWARGLAKSTRRMMEVLYKTFAKKFPTNALLISKSEGNAIRLLAPYKANLEANQRLINDYGTQERIGSWTAEEFITRGKHAFRAVGRGQNPRGSRVDEKRINTLIFDDVDDDEVCRNAERLEEAWLWIMEAVIPTVDISLDYQIFFDNNIIAEDSIAVRAGQYATDVETINIRDEHGKSIWPEKNSEADIDFMLSIISYESGQKEYFNNPMGAGKTFKEIIWGKCPPLKQLQFVIVYGDPATSNKDKPTAKAKVSNSCKSVVVLGKVEEKYYLYTCFLDHMKSSDFVDFLYVANDYVRDKTQAYTYIENNALQDPFYEQVFIPLIYTKGKEHGAVLGVTPDDRKKPDKWFRIEGTLEPINRMGNLIFNIDEKDNPHMLRMQAQFKSASPTSKLMDGPDCVEGAVTICKNKILVRDNGMKAIRRQPNNKRF